MKEIIEKLKFNNDGLIPAIAQQHDDNEIKMLAYMNKESILKTLETKDVYYYSRSRKELWRKGATSGHTQKLVEFYYDCDADTILLKIQQKGPACHTGRDNCFFNKVTIPS